jgi:hypothetical protein
MNTPWWILGAVGGLCLMAMLFEIINLARTLVARRRFARHPEQHEHVPGGWND